MKIINVTDQMTSIVLGRMGENERTTIVFDVAEWLEEYPDATFLLINQLPHSQEEYPVVISQPERTGKVRWVVGGAETAIEGYGQCTLEAVEGTVIAKKHVWRTRILNALGQPGETPEPWESWMTEFARLVGDAEDAVDEAEAWAIGTEETEHPAYENSAKDHAEAAEEARDLAEMWATGGTAGVPSETNNAKYYSENAEAAQDAAERAAEVAITHAGQIDFSINQDGHLIFSYTDQVPVGSV